MLEEIVHDPLIAGLRQESHHENDHYHEDVADFRRHMASVQNTHLARSVYRGEEQQDRRCSVNKPAAYINLHKLTLFCCLVRTIVIKLKHQQSYVRYEQ